MCLLWVGEDCGCGFGFAENDEPLIDREIGHLYFVLIGDSAWSVSIPYYYAFAGLLPRESWDHLPSFWTHVIHPPCTFDRLIQIERRDPDKRLGACC